MAQRLAAAAPMRSIVVAAEHFANFFMNNMPAFAVGMADHYEGPIEDPEWLGIARTSIPGNAALSLRLIREMMQTVDLVLCGGMEVRPRHHGAAAFFDAASTTCRSFR